MTKITPSTHRTLYLSGPMTGYEQHNFPEFDRWAAVLRESGFQVLSPAEMNREIGIDENASMDEVGKLMPLFARRDIEAVLTCDAVAVHGNWASSRGCNAELNLADWLGKPVVCSATLLPVPITVRPINAG